MILDDGILRVCSLKNTAPKGSMPREQLVPLRKYWFAERTIGYSRQYAAKGANEQVDMLVRIPHDRGVRIGMYVVLGNGAQLRIDGVTSGGGSEDGSLRYTDLTLSRLEENFNVATDAGEA